jgi:hypothetical protein
MVDYCQAFTLSLSNSEVVLERTERLPRVEARYHIKTPEGGFRRLLRSFDVGELDSLDIKIESIYGTIRWLRVTPVREEVILDPKYPALYLFNKADAIFVTDEGGSELADSPVVEVWMEINTEVHVGDATAGTLKMWEYSIDTHQLGA